MPLIPGSALQLVLTQRPHRLLPRQSQPNLPPRLLAGSPPPLLNRRRSHRIRGRWTHQPHYRAARRRQRTARARRPLRPPKGLLSSALLPSRLWLRSKRQPSPWARHRLRPTKPMFLQRDSRQKRHRKLRWVAPQRQALFRPTPQRRSRPAWATQQRRGVPRSHAQSRIHCRRRQARPPRTPPPQPVRQLRSPVQKRSSDVPIPDWRRHRGMRPRL
jgi:hypothetical protein